MLFDKIRKFKKKLQESEYEKQRYISLCVMTTVVLSVAWFFIAHMFDRIVRDEIMHEIQDNDYPLELDTDDVIIRGSYLTAYTKTFVTTLPDSSKVHGTNLVISYNLLSNEITMSLGENSELHIEPAFTNRKIYVPKPNLDVTFSRALLKADIQEMDIAVNIKNTSIYLDKEDPDLFVAKIKKFGAELAGNLDEESNIYNFDVSVNAKSIDTHKNLAFDGITSIVAHNIMKTNILGDNFINSDFLRLNKSNITIFDNTDPVNYNAEFTLKLNRGRFNKIQDKFHGISRDTSTFKDFLLDDKYTISFTENTQNRQANNSNKVILSNNKSKVHFAINSSSGLDYNEKQKEYFADNFLEIKSSTPALYYYIKDLKKVNSSFNITYDIDSAMFNDSYTFEVGNFMAVSNGQMRDNIYTTEISVIKPDSWINNMVNYHSSLIKKLEETNIDGQNDSEIANITKMRNNIKDQGFNTLLALHYGKSHETNDPITSKISLNIKNYDLKFNDKKINQDFLKGLIALFMDSVSQINNSTLNKKNKQQ